MAKLPALIATLEVFHPRHDAASIRHAARVLRECKTPLLSAGAGGRGAPHMTPADAVNLLLALNLAVTPSQYAHAAREGGDLPVEKQRLRPSFAKMPPVVAAVLQAETLGAALIVLVERAEELGPPRIRINPFIEPDSGPLQERPTVEVQLVRQNENLLVRVAMTWWRDTPQRADNLYGVRSENAGYGRWTTVHLDQALFLALKRTVVADPPWVFAAEPVRR